MSRSMIQYSLLASFAHPDDEAFGTGGTIARYAEQGIRVDLICATRGEAGEIAEGSDATPQNLGSVREYELRCAAETMGIHELIFLEYRDSGMKGSTDNEDPRAFINADGDEVVSKLVSIIRRLKPLVVVTFEPNGGYGHPDHIAIHRHTVKAFHLAGDANSHPELGEAWQASRLFYTSIPRSFFKEMRAQLEAEGIDTSDFERFEDAAFGWPDEKINAILDVSSSVEEKWDALNCHRTQFGPGNLFRRLPDSKVKQLMSKEHFSLVWPEPEPGLVMQDLFEGL
jgi:N-acetyl-1-D-myo-inositol-2-amino-2-deoxy-alpha-D-glucopyranoside deacetylase